jgi:hypothetical protein
MSSISIITKEDYLGANNMESSIVSISEVNAGLELLTTKYYLVRVQLPWGIIERDKNSFEEAKVVYKNFKEEFKEVCCVIELVSIEDMVKSNGEFVCSGESVIYRKELNKEKSVEYKLARILALVEELHEDAKNNKKLVNDLNQELLDSMHGIEVVNLSLLGGEGRDTILYAIESKRAVRRIAKHEYLLYGTIKDNIMSIHTRVNNSIESLNNFNKSREEHSKSDKDKDVNNRYRKSIGLEV